jgi:chromosome partitioning protein
LLRVELTFQPLLFPATGVVDSPAAGLNKRPGKARIFILQLIVSGWEFPDRNKGAFMKIIAVANQKGGVSKTTFTRERSACCALRGYETLVIDCDPQGNLTSSWVDADVHEATLAHVLIEPEPGPAEVKPEPLPLEDAIVESPVESLDLVPSDIRLARFEMQADYLTHRLRNQLREHADH